MTEESFKVRIGHLSPDTPAADFLVDGYPVLSSREYGDIPDYTEHLADEYEVSVKPTDRKETILKESIQFEPGAIHTLLFVGLKDNLDFMLLTDGTSEK